MTALNKHKLQLLGIAKTWACKTLPGWDDTAHRDLLSRHGAVALPSTEGRVSATSMNLVQLEAALADYEARGWNRLHRQFVPAGAAPGAKRPVPKHIAHLVRLWGRLGQSDKVKDASRPALLAWCERQTQHTLPNLDALTTKESQKIIEALKSWLGRD
ncbi:phage protein GemA/Gp16 family protein [Rhodoferax sp. BLA1]|uniref:phage protein GemA/Gp16 family protein n=1 Tax=Rhodoferax sp. BLA1 TaxID=2576062 RepID=UPI0015D1ACB1|nr:phage protein GemA/Gp16 family protein [Rhodoferax sp. BLA1]